MVGTAEVLTPQSRGRVLSGVLFQLIVPRSFTEVIQAKKGVLDYNPSSILLLGDRISQFSKEKQIREALKKANQAYQRGYLGGTVKGEILDIWGRYVKEGEWMRLGGYRLDTSDRPSWDLFNQSRGLMLYALGNPALVDQAYERIESLTVARSLMK